MMNLTEYQIQADATREAIADPQLYPSPYSPWITAGIAPAVEARMAAATERTMRDAGGWDQRRSDLAALLWYVAVLAAYHGLSLDEIATRELERLAVYYPSPARDAGKGSSCGAE